MADTINAILAQRTAPGGGKYTDFVPGSEAGLGSVFGPGTLDAPGIQAAINLAGLAGGGIVQLPAGTIALSASLVPVSGVKLRGIAPQLAYSSIPDSGNNTFAAGGTVLAPTGAFPAITWNTTVLGTPASQAAFAQGALTNIAFEDLGFSGGSHGIYAGNTNNPSCWWSQFKNLYFIGQTTVGLSLTNYQHCQFNGNYSFNCAWGQYHGIDVASATLAPGNSTYYDLYCVNPVSSVTGGVARNISFITTAALAAAADNNQFKMDRIQSNRFGGITNTQAATMVNTQTTFTVTDGTKFAVGMPVTFSATVNGFTTNLTYFIASVAGNTLSAAATYGGAAIAATGNTAVNITTQGFPCLEIIALANSQMTNMVIDNLDVEGLGTCAVLIQNATGVNIQFSQVPSTAQAAFSLCTRGCAQVMYQAPQSINTDIDQNGSGAGKGVFFFGSRFGSLATGGHAGLGIWLDTVSGKSSLGLGCQFNSATAADLTWDPGTQGGYLAPRVSGIGGAPTKTTSGSITITNLNLSYLNTTASAAMTLPAVSAAIDGAWLEFFNNTGATQTISTNGVQLFNNVAARTTLTLNDKASVKMRAMNLSGSFTWVITGGSSAMAAGVISAPS